MDTDKIKTALKKAYKKKMRKASEMASIDKEDKAEEFYSEGQGIKESIEIIEKLEQEENQ